MKLKKKISSLIICCTLILGSFNFSFADSTRIVTLGANLTSEQKDKMLNYFGVKKDETMILDVTNAEERKYLEGVANDSQLGKVTISCSYVEPTSQGNGINVKTANLTWVTSSMIATTLSTAGLQDANVIVAAPFPVSGTGGLTGVMKAFESSTGKKLDEEKKELATEELVVTGDLGDEVGQEKATGVINDIKAEIIKNGTHDTAQIAETINNITNNYNINLSPEELQKIQDMMLKISKQDYDYNSMKRTLSNVSDNVNADLKALGEDVKGTGLFDSVKGWFGNLFNGGSKNLGILEKTNDSLLGNNAKIDATDDKAIKLPDSQEVEGFFEKVWNWVSGLFGGNSENKTETPKQNNNQNTGSNNAKDVQENNTENNSGDNSSIDIQKETNEHFDTNSENSNNQ